MHRLKPRFLFPWCLGITDRSLSGGALPARTPLAPVDSDAFLNALAEDADLAEGRRLAAARGMRKRVGFELKILLWILASMGAAFILFFVFASAWSFIKQAEAMQ
jgi:hypothetical protein